MQQFHKTQCWKGNLAVRACMSKICNISASMCQQMDCQCNKNHQQCKLFNVSIQTLIQNLNEKGLLARDIILEFYNNLLKQVLRQKEEFLKAISLGGCFLQNQQKLVYKLLVQGPIKDLKPTLIFSVCQKLTVQKQINKNVMKDNVIQKIKLLSEKIKIVLEQTKDIWIFEKQQKIDFQQHLFLPELCNGEYIKVDNNGKRITMLTQPNGDTFSLLSNSIEVYQAPKKFTFLIKKLSQNYIRVGLFQKSVAIKLAFTSNPTLFVQSSNGRIYNEHYPDQSISTSNFNLSTNDILEIYIDNAKRKIKFTNKLKKLSTKQLSFKPVQGDKLHLCVSMYFPTTQIQFIGVQ